MSGTRNRMWEWRAGCCVDRSVREVANSWCRTRIESRSRRGRSFARQSRGCSVPQLALSARGWMSGDVDKKGQGRGRNRLSASNFQCSIIARDSAGTGKVITGNSPGNFRGEGSARLMQRRPRNASLRVPFIPFVHTSPSLSPFGQVAEAAAVNSIRYCLLCAFTLSRSATSASAFVYARNHNASERSDYAANYRRRDEFRSPKGNFFFLSTDQKEKDQRRTRVDIVTRVNRVGRRSRRV